MNNCKGGDVSPVEHPCSVQSKRKALADVGTSGHRGAIATGTGCPELLESHRDVLLGEESTLQKSRQQRVGLQYSVSK